MKAVTQFLIIIFYVSSALVSSAQKNQSTLIKRMRQHESYIISMYLEYQKLYYEDKSRTHELKAFEDLLSVYIDQVMEIYETLNLSQRKTQVPRDIASRALVFKALMLLEKAPLNFEYFERACYEYYESLDLYDGTDDPPVVFKDLPKQIQAGDKTYYRLKDLLEDKGVGLRDFGKVKLSFRNFMVTANFDSEMLELIKIEDAINEEMTNPVRQYTYHLATSRIKKAFGEVFKKSGEVETYVALPHGTYVLRLHGGRKSNFTALTRFYVRANQEQHYIMEPLADWIILYENPTSKRPDYSKFRRNQNDLDSDTLTSTRNFRTNGSGTSTKNASNGTHHENNATQEQLVAEIVAEFMPQFEIKMMFELNDPEIRDNAIQIVSRSIVDYVESRAYYNKWNEWTASWDISERVREIISPGSLIPIELVELVYKVLKEL